MNPPFFAKRFDRQEFPQPTRSLTALGICLAFTLTLFAGDQTEPEREGQEIVARIRATRPAENSSLEGVLKIFQGRRKRAEIPFRSEIVVTPTNWQSRYQILPSTNAVSLESLVISHGESNANAYHWLGTTDPDPGAAQIVRPFATSDFWAGDLGLEFLFWPNQRVLKKELRSGQSCYVLESRNPATNGLPYVRVVSWLDIDSVRDAGMPAIVHADAYDAQNKLLKEFRPKDFKKINGAWQLQEMEMENVQKGTKTRIEFKLEAN